MPNKRLVIEGDVKWLQWSEAKGYKDFDWEDQWVYSLGIKYWPIENLAVRMGYNYGKNPVKEHNGWNPAGITDIQGTNTTIFGYEYFRIIGFPAIVESHFTLGLQYLIGRFSINLGYMHALKTTTKEESAYGAVQLESSLEEDSYSVELVWRF